jgi:hypothetical protein
MALAVILMAPGCASSSTPEQKHFSSPDAAVQSLVAALRDDDHARLKQVLGPAVDDILPSGDEMADRAEVARFLSLYDAGHQIQPDADGASTLLVGERNWPFPVPIVRAGGGYVFDTEAGKEEILNRRIGRNELDAQQVCLAITDAQREYVKLNPTGRSLPEYARKLLSDPGTKNGLYWPTAEGEPDSPLGPLAATAAAEGYGARTGTAQGPPPYHGYFYRLLTSQGPHASGGTIDYLVNGRLVGGFAVVAYPAQYGNSGIMTFITNHEGIVYQRDLGPDTQKIAQSMTQFDPGPEWTRAADGAQPAQFD